MSLHFAVRGLGVERAPIVTHRLETQTACFRAQSFQTVKFTNAKGKVMIIIQVSRSGEVEQKNI